VAEEKALNSNQRKILWEKTLPDVAIDGKRTTNR